MAKIADADKLRAGKLDSAWVKAVWVGRVDKSNEHLLLTAKGCIMSRVVRRIPDGNQASYHAEVQGLPWDTVEGQCRDVEERDSQTRRTAQAIERSTQERRVSSTGENDADDRTRSNSRRTHAGKF